MKKKKQHKKKWYQHWVLNTFVVVIGLITGGCYYVWQKVGPTIQSAIRYGYAKSASLNKHSLDGPKPTVIYDCNGNVIKTLNTKANYTVNEQDANPLLTKGFVAVEDQRFYQNHGVDIYGTARAFAMHFLFHRPLQGGSTITQQLARDKILDSQEQTMSRKISEMVVAQQLTKEFTKKQILIGYLNNCYFGHGAYGISEAAHIYFNKDQKDLTPREAAMIIGLTNNPSLYDPVTNPKLSNQKIKQTLGYMYYAKIINKQQYEDAIHQPTELHLTPIINDTDYTDNYAVSYAMHNAAEDMARQDGFQFKYWFNTDQEYQDYHKAYNLEMQKELDKLVGGGYQIYTSIDMNLQNKIQDAANKALDGYQTKNAQGIVQPQVALTVVDNQTHNVVAIIGGRGTNGDYFNRGFQSYRQPGSTSKPLTAYTPAFMNGKLPQDQIYDGPVKGFPNTKDWFGSFYFKNVTLRDALVQSLNAPALRLAEFNGPSYNTVSPLVKMQFSNLAPEDNNYIISIGGFTNGVNTAEMAGAYSALANQGVYTHQSNVTKIINSNTGNTIYNNDYKKTYVYSPSASYMMLDVMKGVVDGPTVTKPDVADNYPHNLQAAKTGSTDSNKDAYFAEVNYYYSDAVWVGNDNNTPLTEPEQQLAMRVNHNVEEILLAGKQPKDFDKPANVQKNGNDFTVTSKDKNSLEDVNNELYLLNNQNHNSIESLNNNRLNDLDYRIIYGLSKKEEEARQQKVENVLNQININDFNNIDEYSKYQALISKASALNVDVKHAYTHTQLQNKITDLQAEISNQYSYLLLLQQNKQDAIKEQKLQQAKQNLINKNQDKINQIESHFDKDKQAVIDAYNSNDSNKEKQASQTLKDDIAQLNKLGKATPDFTIVTDNQQTVLVPGSTPNLNFQ